MDSKYQDFPNLDIDPKDMFGSWKFFLERITVAVRFEIGTKKLTVSSVDTKINVLSEEMKLCLLL